MHIAKGVVSTGQVEIGVLRTGVLVDSLSSVRYLHGSCTWRFTIIISGSHHNSTSEGPELLLLETDGFTFLCEVNGIVKLRAYTILHGECYTFPVCISRSFTLIMSCMKLKIFPTEAY